MISEEEKQKMKDFIHMGAGISLDSIENALLEHGLKVYNFEIRNAYGEEPKFTIDCYPVHNVRNGNVSKNVTPKNIFKNGLYTTVLWADGTKTIVKRGEDEPDDEYSAFTAALARKIYGTNSAVKRIVRMTKVQSKKYKEPKDNATKDNPTNPFSVLADAVVNQVSKVVESISKPKDACPIDKPCEKSTVEHDLDALNWPDVRPKANPIVVEAFCNFLGIESEFAKNRMSKLTNMEMQIIEDAVKRLIEKEKENGAMNRHDEDWQKVLDKFPDSEKEKFKEAILKMAEEPKYPLVHYVFKAMSGEADKEWENSLNEQAKKQYEEYLAADKWTCPQCGRQYHWQKNDEGRYAFCPKCQLASKEGKA